MQTFRPLVTVQTHRSAKACSFDKMDFLRLKLSIKLLSSKSFLVIFFGGPIELLKSGSFVVFDIYSGPKTIHKTAKGLQFCQHLIPVDSKQPIALLRSSKFDVHPETCWAAAVLNMIFVMDQNCGDPAVVRTLYKTAIYVWG